MRYLPHTPEDIDEMMKTVGVDSLDDLFKTMNCPATNVAQGLMPVINFRTDAGKS